MSLTPHHHHYRPQPINIPTNHRPHLSHWIYNPNMKDFQQFNNFNKTRSDESYYKAFGNTFPEMWLYCHDNPRLIMSPQCLMDYCEKMYVLFDRFPTIGKFQKNKFCIDILRKPYVEIITKLSPNVHIIQSQKKPLAITIKPKVDEDEILLAPTTKIEEPYYYLPRGLLDDEEPYYYQQISNHIKIYHIHSPPGFEPQVKYIVLPH